MKIVVVGEKRIFARGNVVKDELENMFGFVSPLLGEVRGQWIAGGCTARTRI